MIDPSKVLLTSRMRLRLNGVGVVDVVKFESNKQNEQAMALAQVTIALQFLIGSTVLFCVSNYQSMAR